MEAVRCAVLLLLVCTVAAAVTDGAPGEEPSSGSGSRVRVRPDFCSTTFIELDKPCTDDLCNDECMKLIPAFQAPAVVRRRPYDVPLEARYEFAGGVRRMWVYSADKPISATHAGGPRTETKIDEVYRSGVWQFEDEVYVPAGTSGACIMQIFGAAPERQATTLMLHVYDGRLTFYHDLQRVLADGVYDRWLRLNVVHDVGARNVTVFVDGARMLRSRSHGAPGAAHYFKFGVYKQSHHHPSDRMESRWRNVRVFTKP